MSQTDTETRQEREDRLKETYFESAALIHEINAKEIKALDDKIDALRRKRIATEKERDEMWVRERKVMPFDEDLGRCTISGGRKRRHSRKQPERKRRYTRHNKRRRSKTSKKY